MSQRLTIKEAAALAGVTVKTIRRKIDAGLLPAVKESSAHGNRYMIEQADVERLKEAPKKVIPPVQGGGDIERPKGGSEDVAALKKQVEDLTATVAQLNFTINEFMRALPARTEPKQSWWKRLFRHNIH